MSHYEAADFSRPVLSLFFFFFGTHFCEPSPWYGLLHSTTKGRITVLLVGTCHLEPMNTHAHIERMQPWRIHGDRQIRRDEWGVTKSSSICVFFLLSCKTNGNCGLLKPRVQVDLDDHKACLGGSKSTQDSCTPLLRKIPPFHNLNLPRNKESANRRT